MWKDSTQIMAAKPKSDKVHIVCPHCESAISFVSNILESDFAELFNSYRYFGAINPEDNLVCKYCSTKLTRGVTVTLLRSFPSGPVKRDAD